MPTDYSLFKSLSLEHVQVIAELRTSATDNEVLLARQGKSLAESSAGGSGSATGVSGASPDTIYRNEALSQAAVASNEISKLTEDRDLARAEADELAKEICSLQDLLMLSRSQVGAPRKSKSETES